ncbi:MAG: hypothetical protein DWQ08_07065 [Proteobacteria bacterium]|nr:MAG: hypothetical protein DWQ08_07065 [Pseudomonadota bacterium]
MSAFSNDSFRGLRRPRSVFVDWRAAAVAAMLLVLTAPANAIPVMKILELSKEGALITYKVNARGVGTASVSTCEDCKDTIKLRITANSKLVVQGVETPFEKVPRLKNRRVTVYYLPKKNLLTRLIIDEPVR